MNSASCLRWAKLLKLKQIKSHTGMETSMSDQCWILINDSAGRTCRCVYLSLLIIVLASLFYEVLEMWSSWVVLIQWCDGGSCENRCTDLVLHRQHTVSVLRQLSHGQHAVVGRRDDIILCWRVHGSDNPGHPWEFFLQQAEHSGSQTRTGPWAGKQTVSLVCVTSRRTRNQASNLRRVSEVLGYSPWFTATLLKWDHHVVGTACSHSLLTNTQTNGGCGDPSAGQKIAKLQVQFPSACPDVEVFLGQALNRTLLPAQQLCHHQYECVWMPVKNYNDSKRF